MSITGEGLWWSLFYDMDTVFGLNNEGEMAFHPYYEWGDQVDGGTAYVYNGYRNLLWERMLTCFPNEIKQMYQSMRTGNWTRAKIIANYDNHQLKWGERLYNENAYVKYLEPYVIDGDDTYFGMLLGDGKSHRHYFINNRIDYLDSKFNAGESLSNFATVRGYQSANIQVAYLTPMYASIKYGSQLVQVRQKVAGTLTSVPIPTGMQINDTETYIYSAHKLTEIKNLADYKIGYADFTQATALRKLIIGNHSDDTYTNTNFRTLNLGNNILLEELDCSGCPNLSGNIDISHCTNLEKMYFERTSITGLSLPTDTTFNQIYVPDTIRTMYLKNNTCTGFYFDGELMQKEDFDELTQFSYTESNINNLDIVDIVLNLQAGCYTRVVKTGMTISTKAKTEELIDKLATLHGIDDNGEFVENPQFGGTLYIDDYITQAELSILQALIPLVTITCKGYVYSVKIYGADMQTLAYNQTFHSGATLPTISTYIPAQYNEGRIGSKYCVQNGGYIKIGNTKTIYESATWDSHKTDLDGATINSNIEIGGNFAEYDITFQVKYRYYYQNVNNYIDLLQNPKTVTYGQPFTLTEPDTITVTSGEVWDVLGSHAVENSKNHMRQQANPVVYYVPVDNVFTVPFGDVDFKQTQSVGGYIYTGEVYCIADDDIVDTAFGIPLNDPQQLHFDYERFKSTKLDEAYIETGKNILVYNKSAFSWSDFSENTYITTPSSSDYQTVLDLISSVTTTLYCKCMYLPITNIKTTTHSPSDYIMLLFVDQSSTSFACLSDFFYRMTTNRSTYSSLGNKSAYDKFRECIDDLNVELYGMVGGWDYYNNVSYQYRLIMGLGDTDYQSSTQKRYEDASRPRLYSAISTTLNFSGTQYTTHSNGATFITNYTVNHSGVCYGVQRSTDTFAKYPIGTYGFIKMFQGGLPYSEYTTQFVSDHNASNVYSAHSTGDYLSNEIWITLNHNKDDIYGDMYWMGLVGFMQYQYIRLNFKFELLDGTFTDMYTFDSNDIEFSDYPMIKFRQIKKVWFYHYNIWRCSTKYFKHYMCWGRYDQPNEPYLAHVYVQIDKMFAYRSMLSRALTKEASTDIDVTPVCEVLDKDSRYSYNAMGKNNMCGNKHSTISLANPPTAYMYDTLNDTCSEILATSESLYSIYSKLSNGTRYRAFSSTFTAEYGYPLETRWVVTIADTLQAPTQVIKADKMWLLPKTSANESRKLVIKDIIDENHPLGSINLGTYIDHYKTVGTPTGVPLSREYVIHGRKGNHMILDETLFQLPHYRPDATTGQSQAQDYHLYWAEITSELKNICELAVNNGYGGQKYVALQSEIQKIDYAPDEMVTIFGSNAVTSPTRLFSSSGQAITYSMSKSTTLKMDNGSGYIWLPWSTTDYVDSVGLPTKSNTVLGQNQLMFFRFYSTNDYVITSTDLERLTFQLYTLNSNNYIAHALAIPFTDIATEHTTTDGYKYWEIALRFNHLQLPVYGFICTSNSSALTGQFYCSWHNVHSYTMPAQYDMHRLDSRLVDFETLSLPNAKYIDAISNGIAVPVYINADTSSWTGTLAEWKAIAYGTS